MDLEAPVTNVMTQAPVTVQVGQPLSEARRVMTEGGYHRVPVLRGAQLVGMLSSADLLRVSSGCEAVPLQQMGAGERPLGIEALMSSALVVLTPASPVHRLARRGLPRGCRDAWVRWRTPPVRPHTPRPPVSGPRGIGRRHTPCSLVLRRVS